MADDISANTDFPKEINYDDVVRESAMARWAYRLALIPALGLPLYLLFALTAFFRMGVVGQTGFHYLAGGLRRVLILNMTMLGAIAAWWFLPQEIILNDGGQYFGGGSMARDWSINLEKKKHGRWSEYNPEYNLNVNTWNWRVCHYQHGILNGEYNEFFNSKTKCSSGRFENGKKQGLWSYWHLNGAKKEEGPYVKGLPTGDWLFWNDAGGKRRQGKLLNGKEEGKWTEWLENGQILSIGEFRDGKQSGKWSFFRPNGQLMWEGDYLNGNPHGKFTTFFSNGLIEKEGECYRGKYTGLFNIYYNNGSMRATGNMEGGYYLDNAWHGRTGLWTFWYPSGIIAAEGKFKTINPGERPRSDYDYKVGLWRYWNQNGFQLRDKTYDDYGKVSVESAEKGQGKYKTIKARTSTQRYSSGPILKRKLKKPENIKEPEKNPKKIEPVAPVEPTEPDELDKAAKAAEPQEDDTAEPTIEDELDYNSRQTEYTYKVGDWKELGPIGKFHGSYLENSAKKKSAPSGLWTEYYPDAKQKAAEGTINNYRNGPWTFWHENGRKKAEGEYNSSPYKTQVDSDFSDNVDNGEYILNVFRENNKVVKRNGKWTYWNSDGQKTMEEVFLKCQLQERTTYFYDKGELVRVVKHLIDVSANAPIKIEHRDGNDRIIYSKEFK